MKVHTAYFAGFFDGEGYVGAVYQEGWDSYIMRASVTNNNRDVLKMYEDTFGGRIFAPKNYGMKDGKSAWTWCVHGKNLQRFLNEILPFVVVKKPQVELALQFPFGSRGQRVTEDMQAKRHFICERLMEMKLESFTEPSAEDYVNSDFWRNNQTVEQAIELYQSEKTQNEVADILGVTRGAIGYWLRQTDNVRPRRIAGKLAGQKRQDGPKSPEAQRAAELYQAGVPIAQIARQLEAKPATVNYWLRRKGLTRSYKEAQQLRRGRERESFDQ